MSLTTAVADPNTRRRLAKEAVVEARAAIQDMSGVTGKLVLTGFDAAQKIRPGFLEDNVHTLLPGWAEAIEPHWEAGKAAGDPEAHLNNNALEVANDLLSVTDAHAEQAGDQTARAVYQRLRPRAPKRVAAHMPRLASFVTRNT